MRRKAKVENSWILLDLGEGRLEKGEWKSRFGNGNKFEALAAKPAASRQPPVAS